MLKDGYRRRSPRISALDAWKSHQPSATFSSNSNSSLWVQPMLGHRHNQDDHQGQGQGPPSRTRARIKRKTQQRDVEDPNQEDHSTNSGESLSFIADATVFNYTRLSLGKQSGISPIPFMPEKRILELVLDILQRRDTYEIFAEPVDPKEVDDYYEIIKEPMDFGTMRAKLHEGLYNNLEQFEHDALLIPRNAMHFNSTATIFFRQARAIYELAKKVFHFLKTDPQNFESEFSGTRRRSGRRSQGEGKGLNFNSCPAPRLATNVRSSTMTNDISSKGTWCSQSGPSNPRRSIRRNPGFSCKATCLDKRDYDFSPGAKKARRSNFIEADRRCTYRPMIPFCNENDYIGSTIYSEPKPLTRVNQWDMSYRQSLMLFAKDLGPTAQMVANRKLQGWWKNAPSLQNPASNLWGQAATCQFPAALTSAQKSPVAQDAEITNTCQGFFDSLPSCSVIKPLTDTIDLTDSDDGEKTYTINRMGNHNTLVGKVATNDEEGRMDNHSALVGKVATNDQGGMMGDHIASKGKVACNNERSTSRECHGMKIFGINHGDDILENQISKIHMGLYSSGSRAEDLNTSVIKINETSKKPMAATVDSGKMDDHVQQSISASEGSQPSEVGFKLRNSKRTTSSSWPWHTGGVSSLNWNDCSMHGKSSKYETPVTAEGPKDGTSSSSQASQYVASPFAFDLPFLESRLNQMNHISENGFLEPRFWQAPGPSLGQMRSNKRTFECIHQEVLLSQLAIDNNQQRSVLDTLDTDLALQL
ncbi:hypothetical protein U1Q18_013984 [Sarracenia purpurea var. burkii]